MAAVTICSDFGAPKNKVWHCFQCFPIYFPWSDGTVVSSAYLRLLIFLPAILIPACVSSSPAFLMMYSAYKLNKHPWCVTNHFNLHRLWSRNCYNPHFPVDETEVQKCARRVRVRSRWWDSYSGHRNTALHCVRPCSNLSCAGPDGVPAPSDTDFLGTQLCVFYFSLTRAWVQSERHHRGTTLELNPLEKL